MQRRRVRIEMTPLGRGVFAAERIKKGQMIGEMIGAIKPEAELAQSEYAVELGPDMSLDPEPPFRFLNHSCQPNCELIVWEDEEEAKPGVPPRLLVRAMREIRTDDQLTIDYAWPADMAIPCGCQSQKCRGWIVDLAELDKVKGRGISAPHFLPESQRSEAGG